MCTKTKTNFEKENRGKVKILETFDLGFLIVKLVQKWNPVATAVAKKKCSRMQGKHNAAKNVRAVTFSTLLLVTDNTTNISSAESYKWQCTSFPNLYKRFRHTLYNKDVRARLFVSDYRLRN